MFRNSVLFFLSVLLSFMFFSCEQKTSFKKREFIKNDSKDMVLFAGGDLVCASHVENAIKVYGYEYPFLKVKEFIEKADLAFANLECVVSDRGSVRSSDPKKINYNASPNVLESLHYSGIDVFSIANNHVYDVGSTGLKRFRELLDKTSQYYGGAGKDINEAASPVIINVNGLKIGFIFYNSTGFNFCASKESDGYNCINFVDTKQALSTLKRDFSKIKNTDIQILSIHWGQNYTTEPSKEQKAFAHMAVDHGVDVFLGHSAHLFHGIEIYKGIPILYDLGDLLVDKHDGWDVRSFLFYIQIKNGKPSGLELFPIYIPDSQIRVAKGIMADEIISRMTLLSKQFGTEIVSEDGKINIEIKK